MYLNNELKIAVVGLGYVGLPLAVEFAKKFNVIGFDINSNRISELVGGLDVTLEVTSEELSAVKNIKYSSDSDDLTGADVFIITVPTPIDENNYPDFTPLIKSSQNVGGYIKKDGVVIFESTVYPGATEEVCVPEIEKKSGLKFNKDFYVGYSPERINPGDKVNKLTKIKKITSGSTEKVSKFVDKLYSEIIEAGTYSAPSIKVAEAAKVIENTQRGVNIALVNEFSMIFGNMGLDTQEVLDAAGTKWNFLKFKPGLVGGHCIGVDPYYLIHKAKQVGVNPKIIDASCRTNDGMGKYVASKLIKAMIKKKINVAESKILIMGYTFKENCPDTRNSKVLDIYKELYDFGAKLDVYDPWVDKSDLEDDVNLIEEIEINSYDAIAIAVGHEIFLKKGIAEIKRFCKKDAIVFDIKSVFAASESDIRL